MAPLFLGFAVFWTVTAFASTAGSYFVLAYALRGGHCEAVEGVVSDFHPMQYTGHGSEWFIVGGKRFEYSDYELSAGFNNTASHGGPIHGGVLVRVHYRGNDIAKLEVGH
jgi:hypothetical protein